MAQWIGAQGQVKVAKNTPTCGVPPRNPPQNEKNCFSISTTKLAESVEDLNSSLAQCFPTFFSSRPTFNASFIVRPTMRYTTKINSYVRPASFLLFTWNQQTTNLPIVIVAYLHFPTSRGVRTEIVTATQHI